MTSADRVQGVNQIQARGREVASIGTGKGNSKNLADVIGERPLRVREASHCRQSILFLGLWASPRKLYILPLGVLSHFGATKTRVKFSQGE